MRRVCDVIVRRVRTPSAFHKDGAVYRVYSFNALGGCLLQKSLSKMAFSNQKSTRTRKKSWKRLKPDFALKIFGISARKIINALGVKWVKHGISK